MLDRRTLLLGRTMFSKRSVMITNHWFLDSWEVKVNSTSDANQRGNGQVYEMCPIAGVCSWHCIQSIQLLLNLCKHSFIHDLTQTDKYHVSQLFRTASPWVWSATDCSLARSNSCLLNTKWLVSDADTQVCKDALSSFFNPSFVFDRKLSLTEIMFIENYYFILFCVF